MQDFYLPLAAPELPNSKPTKGFELNGSSPLEAPKNQ
jgi:hypothetical protein